MTEEKFKEITQLQDKIHKKQSEIRNINSLLVSCGLSCEISGTPSYTTNRKIEYHFANKEEIKKILEIDKVRLVAELSELQKEFESL